MIVIKILIKMINRQVHTNVEQDKLPGENVFYLKDYKSKSIFHNLILSI